MTRDYSQFMPALASTPIQRSTLDDLGWQPFFAQQTDIETLKATPPVRVTQAHRASLQVMGDGIDESIPIVPDVTVGDWLLYDRDLPHNAQVLERKSLMKRRAAGHDRSVQLIAANIDTSFIVTSCNADFNVARLERYIALALEAGIDPVIVLTKRDLADDPDPYIEQARAISDLVPVVALNALSDAPHDLLRDWCKPRRTVAFLGSSGVGKSTLANTLAGREIMDTGGIREDDAKGRHTTTHRQLHLVPAGFAVLDTPGMRELQMADASSGIDDLFDDLATLASQCKFRDCAHESEPGCAVRAAVAAGQIEEDRLMRWRKLKAEDAFNSASLAERRVKDRAFGKMVKQAMQKKKR